MRESRTGHVGVVSPKGVVADRQWACEGIGGIPGVSELVGALCDGFLYPRGPGADR